MLLKIATRQSPLALWQANEVARQLKEIHADLEVELVGMTTKGDQILDSPLSKIGGKGLFVKELEVGMLEGRADIAVHSMKDVPMHFPEGLYLATILERHDPYDAFVSNQYNSLSALPEGAVLGTSSLRREALVREHRPDLTIKPLRGNINSRMQKMDDGEYDAIILAASGLKRMEFDERIKEVISADILLPAVGQGALGIECRSNDPDIEALIAPLMHQETWDRVITERAMNNRLNGGCQIPVAGFAEINGDELHLRGRIGFPDGSTVYRAEATGRVKDAEAIGVQVAEDLLAQGGDKVLASLGIEA